MSVAQILLAVFELEWVVFTIVSIADVVTTNQFLKEGKATEGSWVSRQLQAWLGGPKGYQGPWWIGKLVIVIALQGVGLAMWKYAAPQISGLMVFLLAGLIVYYWSEVLQPNIEVDRGKD